MSEPIVWGHFTQAALDAAYNNVAAVPKSPQYNAAWAERSAALRARLPAELDIAYGDAPRQRLDIYRCGASNAPMLAYIHGGWWQRNSKEVHAFVAEGPLGAGFDVAMLGYTLAPEAKLTQIVAEIGAALDKVQAHQRQRGGRGDVILAGWSAGGHLTAACMDHPAVRSGIAISGVFDLEPIRHSYINDKLQLEPAEITALSPGRKAPTGKRLALSFGLDELPELQRQSADYGRWCARHGAAVLGYPLFAHNHFSILEQLADPAGALVDLLRAVARD